jgi:hypothetical protein
MLRLTGAVTADDLTFLRNIAGSFSPHRDTTRGAVAAALRGGRP